MPEKEPRSQPEPEPEEPRSEKRKFSELGEEYRLFKQFESTPEIFGQRVVDRVKTLREELYHPGDRKEQERIESHGLKREIEKARKIVEDYKKEGFAVVTFFSPLMPFFEESVANPKIKEKFQEFVQREQDPDLFLEDEDDLHHNFARLPDDIFVEMLLNHVENFQGRWRTFEKNVPALKKDFHERMTTASKEGIFSIDSTILEERIRDTKAELADALYASLEEYYGAFKVDSNKVLLASHIVKKKNLTKKVFIHEMLHAVSGRTIIGSNLGSKNYEVWVVTGHQRVGTDFEGEFIAKPRFEWMNEAITERLTEKLADQKEKGKWESYKSEQRLLQLLQENGTQQIPDKVFFDAYFENLDPKAPPEKRIPKWRELRKQINGAFDPGFLIRLDNYVSEQGVEAAVTQMEQDWKKI